MKLTVEHQDEAGMTLDQQPGPPPMRQMSKQEREELLKLVRRREAVQKTHAEQRSALLLADFEAKIAAVYDFDDDEVWAQAWKLASEAAEKAQKVIAERCAEIGIPAEFAPGISMGWHGRGQNAVKARREELRRVAKARIAAIEKDARVKIEIASVNAQTEIVTHGLASTAAREFLENLAPVETLMPELQIGDVERLLDEKTRRRKAGLLSYGE